MKNLRCRIPPVLFALAALLSASCFRFGKPAEPPSYRGPLIDFHAHVRLGDDDAASADQPKGIEPMLALDDQAGVARTALIVMARKGELEATRAQNDAVVAEAKKAGDRAFAV